MLCSNVKNKFEKPIDLANAAFACLLSFLDNNLKHLNKNHYKHDIQSFIYFILPFKTCSKHVQNMFKKN
jgi:hypothetical protein